MSRPLWVDLETSIKKTATMKPQSPFPTGVAQSWDMCMYWCVWANQSHFSREITFQDSVLERAKGGLKTQIFQKTDYQPEGTVPQH